MSLPMLEIMLATLLALTTLCTALSMVRSMKKLGRRPLAHDQPAACKRQPR